MTSTDFAALSPLIVLGLTPIVVMLSIAVRRRHSVSLTISLVGLIAALACVLLSNSVAPLDITKLFHVHAQGLFFVGLTISIALMILSMGYSYLAHRESHPEEYYILVLIATAGACVMCLSSHFVSFYLGLEILSVAQYGLVAYMRRDPRGTEAGLKYLVLAAASAAFLLFGMALVYAELGTMRFESFVNASPEQLQNRVVLLGVAMMFASIGFKLSIVPFHYWTPDVYEGAPASVAAFTSTAGKVGVLAILVRYFALEDSAISSALAIFIAVTGAASMIVGNLLALVQTNLKRVLAYSSIAHMGYLSLAFLGSRDTATATVAFYMVAYSAATVAAFGVIMALSTGFNHSRDIERLEDYKGLYRTNPILATVLGISLLSMAGIPMTAGFFGKLYVVFAGAESTQWVLLIILALGSAVGAYYYLRVAMMLFANTDSVQPDVTPPLAMQILLLLLTVGTVALGLFPGLLLSVLSNLSGV